MGLSRLFIFSVWVLGLIIPYGCLGFWFRVRGGWFEGEGFMGKRTKVETAGERDSGERVQSSEVRV